MKNIQKNVTLQLDFIKSKNGNICAMLVADLGYRKRQVTFDEFAITEILGITMNDLYALKSEYKNEVDNV